MRITKEREMIFLDDTQSYTDKYQNSLDRQHERCKENSFWSYSDLD